MFWAKVHPIIKVFKLEYNLHSLSCPVKVKLAIELHWYVILRISPRGRHHKYLFITLIITMVQERSLVNIQSSLILTYNFS